MIKRIIPQTHLDRSRDLRKRQTPWEARLWQYLRAGRFYGINFKRQVQIGNYIVDFSCRGRKLVIELDGGQHSQKSESNYDQLRSGFLEREGYTVLRFWNNEIDENIDGVLEAIRRAVLEMQP